MVELRLQPIFVGKDVECPKAKKQKFMVLAIAADDPVLPGTRESFFDSLNTHSYNRFTEEVSFKKHKLVLNVSALNQNEAIRLKDPQLLFSDVEGLYTSIQYLGCHTIWRLNPKRILGSSGDPSQLLESIEQGFSIEVHLETGQCRRQDFQVPGPPKQFATVFGSLQLPNPEL